MAPATTVVTDFEHVLRTFNEVYTEEEDTKEIQEIHNKTLEFRPKRILEDLKSLDYSKVVWLNVLIFSLLHIYSCYGIILAFTNCYWKTIVFSWLLYFLGTVGVTMGAHRLWSHRAMKAVLPIRILLVIFQTLAFQNDIYTWVRDHRAHHKFVETDADPHDARRGLFFAHIGWLMYRKHPQVIAKGRKIDVTDVLEDPVVQFQRNHYKSLVISITFVLPTLIPWYFWGETFLTSLLVAGFLRYALSLHATWLVNSVAHWIGSKPYDESIRATQNLFVSVITNGEGWHNFHHVFPQDYRAAELGGWLNFNLTTHIIDFCAYMGWIWNRKLVSSEICKKRAQRTGDGSRFEYRSL